MLIQKNKLFMNIKSGALKILLYIGMVMLPLLCFFSCNKFSDLNKDVKSPYVGSSNALFNSAEKNLFDIMTNTSVNRNVFRLFAQYWTQTDYTDESNYNVFTRKVPDNFASYLYINVLTNLKRSKHIFLESLPSAAKKGKLDSLEALLNICRVDILKIYSYSILFELYGNMPYTEALDIDNLSPNYDDAKTSYYSLIDSLDSTIKNIKAIYNSEALASNADLKKNVDKWKKIANSLKLRMAITLSGIDNNRASNFIKEAVQEGVFVSNDDSYLFTYTSIFPNNNPLWEDLVQSNRSDYVGANTLVDIMDKDGLNDPRLKYYLDTIANPDTVWIDTKDKSQGIKKIYEKYKGGEYGLGSGSKTHSNPGNKLKSKTLPGVLLDYAEVQFYLAEAVERGLIGGSAEAYYKNGITASIKYWGGTDEEVNAYLSNSKVAYSTADGNWKKKIGIQSWLAFYNRGYEGWTVWRRLGYPNFNPPPKKTISDVPVRFTYPVNEQTRNSKNYTKASEAIGTDSLTTRLWWNK